jgi:hypothetical protein
MNVSVAGVGAAMTASAACSPASFTEGVLALQFAAVNYVADQFSSQTCGMHVSVAGVGAAMTASAACSPASFTDGVLALRYAAVDHVADQFSSQKCMFPWLAWVLP